MKMTKMILSNVRFFLFFCFVFVRGNSSNIFFACFNEFFFTLYFSIFFDIYKRKYHNFLVDPY